MSDAQAQPTAGLCSVHSERVADAGTCARCGSFMCADCLHEGTGSALCEPCFERVDSTDAVRRMPVFAIVMMTHGGLIVLLGLVFVIYAFSLGVSFGSMEPPAASDAAQTLLPTMLTGMMSVMGLVHLGAGLLQLVAGYQLLKFRFRWLTVTALVAGLSTFLGCYCGVTSLALLIVGLVVLFHSDVSKRFELSS